MAKPKNSNEESQVSNWLGRISISERTRDHYERKYLWQTFIQEYKCWWESVLPPEITPYNYVYSWAKTELASLYLKDPHIEINPTKKASIEQARIRELAISDIIRRKKIKRELKKNILDGLLISFSWAKVGYMADFDMMVDKEGNQLQTIVDEDFFYYRVPWDQVTFNSDAVNVPFDCRWIAHELWIPFEELKKKKGWKHLAELEKQAAPIKRRQDKPHMEDDRARLLHEDIKFVQIYEIWDIKTKEVKYVAPGVSKYLFKKPWPYKLMKGFPFSFWDPNPVNDEPYGVPDVFTFHGQMLELMKVDHTIDDHVKKGNRQIIISADNEILPESVKPYQEGDTGAILKFQSVAREKLNTLPFLNVLQDVYPLRLIRKENILNTNGQAATERGATEKTSTRTFKELALIDRGAKNRRAERLDTFEDFMEDAFSKLLALQAEFGSIPYYVRVTGEQPQDLMQVITQRPSADQPGAITNQRNGRLQGFTVTGEDLGNTGQEEFDIDIQAGSTIPLDRENVVQMLQFLGENAVKAGAIPGGPLMGAIAKRLFQETDLPDLQLALEQEQQMQQQMQQQQADLQKQQAQMQAANEAAKTQINVERESSRSRSVDIDAFGAQTDRIKANKDTKGE